MIMTPMTPPPMPMSADTNPTPTPSASRKSPCGIDRSGCSTDFVSRSRRTATANAPSPSTKIEIVSTVTLFLLYAVPTFWAGLMLQLIFGKTGLDWLPVLGLHDKNADELSGFAYWLDTAEHSILPIAVLSYGGLAYLSRQMRVGVVDSITQDYVRTARAKGLDEKVVIFKHVLRNSVIPIITLLASILPILIGGSIIVETVFDIPGMGRYAYEGLTKREYNVIMATTMFSALMTILGILISDIMYAIVDPRISYD